ncbi:hypothetical protein PMAYCL1PPCAC_17058, partial [Pristionchus mayeri]
IIALSIYQLAISAAVGVIGAASEASWISDDDGGFYPQLHLSERGKMWFCGVLIFSVVFILAICCTYAVAYAKLRKQMQSITTGAPPDKAERSLTYIAILTCVVEVVYYAIFAYVFLIAKDVESDSLSFHFVLAIQCNLTSGVHPYLLLVFSDLARKAV